MTTESEEEGELPETEDERYTEDEEIEDVPNDDDRSI
jgi:hypothetical protein